MFIKVKALEGLTSKVEPKITIPAKLIIKSKVKLLVINLNIILF